MQHLPRRQLGRLALAGAGALVARRPPTAQAATLLDPGGGGLPLRYVLRRSSEPTATAIDARSAPTTQADVVTTLPFGTPLGVLGQTAGERLFFGDGTWTQVALPYGPAWVYAALLGRAPDGPIALPLAGPVPAPASAPGPVGPGKSIVVSRDDQFLWAYQDTTTVLAVGCTTGNSELATPLGAFAVSARFHPYEFVSPWPAGSPDWYPPSPVSYALRFHDGGFYLHDAPWRHVFGPASQGGAGPPGGDQTGSHGCVNLPYPAARFLSAWAPVGTPVQVVGTGRRSIPASGVPQPGLPAVGTPAPQPALPVPHQPLVAGAPGGATGGPTYTVRPGETLFGLAHRFGVPVATLARRNGLRNPHDLRAGQVLRLPPAAT